MRGPAEGLTIGTGRHKLLDMPQDLNKRLNEVIEKLRLGTITKTATDLVIDPELAEEILSYLSGAKWSDRADTVPYDRASRPNFDE